MRSKTLMDIKHDHTLAGQIRDAFSKVAPMYGVRLEGIENDINEHMDFWLMVAREALDLPRTAAEGNP